MKRKSPPVRDYTSKLPIELPQTATLSEALEAMTASNIRHLPVMNGFRVVGIVSLHDVEKNLAEQGDRAKGLPLGEFCSRDLLRVSPTDSVADVTQKMLERHVGSALVEDAEVVIGLYTSTDAMRVIVDHFKQSGKSP